MSDDAFQPASFRPATDREFVEGLQIEGDHPTVAHIQRLQALALRWAEERDVRQRCLDQIEDESGAWGNMTGAEQEFVRRLRAAFGVDRLGTGDTNPQWGRKACNRVTDVAFFTLSNLCPLPHMAAGTVAFAGEDRAARAWSPAIWFAGELIVPPFRPRKTRKVLSLGKGGLRGRYLGCDRHSTENAVRCPAPTPDPLGITPRRRGTRRVPGTARFGYPCREAPQSGDGRVSGCSPPP